MRRILPVSAPPDVTRVVWGRAIRGFADGYVSVLLAQYLTGLGFSPIEVGAIVTATLLGSAVVTLTFGLTAHRTTLRALLLIGTGVMAATGIGFATITWFWPLLVVAALGTLNPSSGDVSVFLPTEQAYVAGEVPPAERPHLFAVYNLGAIFTGAVGALLSGLPEGMAHRNGWAVVTAQRAGFVLYAVAAVVIFVLYRRLGSDPSPTRVGPGRPPTSGPTPAPTSATTSGPTSALTGGPADGAEQSGSAGTRRRPLPTSRRTVLELAGLFSLVSAGSGFVVTSLLVLWLHLRFDLGAGATGAVFFAAGLLGACSQALAPRLARRFGLIRTMAFTHIPANCLLVLAAFAPNGGVAIALLLARALFAQMDVPARQAFVMAVVPADERAAAASVTNVPRSLASATTPLLAGVLLDHTTFGWPLVIAGVTKITYDLLLLGLYRDVPEEVGARRSRSGWARRW
jgi:MFS family permease